MQEYKPGRFTEIASVGGRAAEVTLIEGDDAGKKVLFEEDGSQSGSLGSPELDAQARDHAEDLIWLEKSELHGPMFVDVVGPAPRLIMFGAVPIAAALCTLARAAGWRPFVVDPRRASPPRSAFPTPSR